jgi:hypothetical protein
MPYAYSLQEKLICILVNALLRIEVSDKLKEHLLILKPGVGFFLPFCLSHLISYVYSGLSGDAPLGYVWHQLPSKTSI